MSTLRGVRLGNRVALSRAFLSVLSICAFYPASRAMAAPTNVEVVPAAPLEFHEIETKNIFGFANGADIGLEGEKEIEFATNGSFKKRSGRYRVIEQEIEFEAVPTQFFSYELSLHGLSHHIRGVDDIDDINRTTISGFSANLRFLLLGRGPGQPFGLTFSVEPEYSRIDGGSGVRTRNYSATFRLAADTELIPNRLYGAFNLTYEPETNREAGSDSVERSSSLGLITALAYRITPEITVGGVVEYDRAYDGLAFRAFAGEALYIGPTLHIQLNRKAYVAAAFATQIYGHASGETFKLDLSNFERHRAFFRLGLEF